jgi:hypothetical protein
MKRECIDACLNEIKQTVQTLESVIGTDDAFPVTSRLVEAWEALRKLRGASTDGLANTEEHP